MATRRQINSWMKKLQKHEAAVSKERDKLQDTIDELEALKEACDRALYSIQEAIDALSELV